ncbi:MAG: hypothetical protein ABJA02_11770 [Acidobacteriota bacterium]
MTEDERAGAKAWVENWKTLGPELARPRVSEYRKADRVQVFLSLGDASRASLAAHPPKPTSGMIEMQRLFAKLYK